MFLKDQIFVGNDLSDPCEFPKCKCFPQHLWGKTYGLTAVLAAHRKNEIRVFNVVKRKLLRSMLVRELNLEVLCNRQLRVGHRTTHKCLSACTMRGDGKFPQCLTQKQLS